jgi:hypothetical protein
MNGSTIDKNVSYETIMGSIKHYPVKWLLNALQYKRGKTCHICICGYSHRIWYMAQDGDNPLKPFVINSIDIAEGECMDGKWCLDQDCKYNKTTPESYAKSYHLSPKETEEFIDGWDQFIKNVKGINRILTEEYEDDELGLKGFHETEIMKGPRPLVEWVKTEP